MGPHANIKSTPSIINSGALCLVEVTYLEDPFGFCSKSLEFSQVKVILLQEFVLKVQDQQAINIRLRKQHYIIAT